MAETNDNEQIGKIRAQAESVIASGVLGRSRFYKALLEYLVDCAGRGHAPKEIEIAADVFRRGEQFDPSQDSMVRVYVHNLRQKLAQYYQGPGADQEIRLAIPKGEYRIVLGESDPDTGRIVADTTTRQVTVNPARIMRVAALVLIGLVGGLLIARFVGTAEHPLIAQYQGVSSSPYWASMLDDDRPVVIVVGDYYIFGELGPDGYVERLVREFEVNSRLDLDNLMMRDPAAADRYIDLSLTYLPTSTAVALRDFLRVLYTTDKTVRVEPMSNLAAADIRDAHIVYVGYLSGLDKLFDFVFAGSDLAIGRTFDEIVNTADGTIFHSDAGIPSEQRNYRDYGLVSVFPGPNGNQFLILAGTRDEGLMHSAFSVSDPDYAPSSIDTVRDALGEVPEAFEILYEVAGFDRTNLDATVVHVAKLRDDLIWTGELPLPE